MSHGFARRNFASAPATVTGWQRPEEWLALPRPNIGDHKAVGLFAVTNGNNYVAIECSGQFAVDWGDGLGPQAYTNSCEKNLGWGDYSASTLTSRGYRQAVVTVTPRGTGVFDGLDFSLKHSAAASNSQVNWLDVIVSGPNISTASLFYRSNGQQSRMLEQFELVGVTSQTNMTSMFQGCSSLQSVELTGCVIDIAVNGCRLEGPALNALYTSLGTPGPSRTINVTGNPGTPFDNPTIATAKGWTVTGS